MTPLSLRVLRLFGEMGEDRLDLHVLFEAAGNEPSERQRVLDAIDELVREGMLDACGADFYALTEKGKRQSLGEQGMREALIVGSLLVPVSVAQAKLFVSFLTRQGQTGALTSIFSQAKRILNHGSSSP